MKEIPLGNGLRTEDGSLPAGGGMEDRIQETEYRIQEIREPGYQGEE